jgi:uncharacterized protein (TIGR02246 family)
MATDTPDGTVRTFMELFNAGDLDAAVALYEPGATFVPAPGRVVSGIDAVREALQAYLALGPKFAGELQSVTAAGDTALVVNNWHSDATAPDGTAIHQSGRSADVLRRQPDGRWLILIDNPWG